ncbi:hypothetical protein JL721_5480 [Aureococcus anophagefferens]|nr:hypothetical protein JL721_5480 [Aureococcus anophagefferens]
MAPPRRFVLRRDDTIHPVPRHPEELVIGRSRSCGVVVNDSAKISGKHVSVSAVDESVVLTNYSSNGVYIAGDGARFSATRPTPDDSPDSPTSVAAAEDVDHGAPALEPYGALDGVSRHLFARRRGPPRRSARSRLLAPAPVAAPERARRPAAAGEPPAKRAKVLSPLKRHVIERRRPLQRRRDRVPTLDRASPASPPRPAAAAALSVLSWNLGGENRGGRGAQEVPVDGAVDARYRFHELLALGLDRGLRWVDGDAMAASPLGRRPFRGRAILASTNVAVADAGHAVLDGWDPDANAAAPRTLPYVDLRVRGAGTDQAARVVLGCVHVRCGDRTMRAAARRWLRRWGGGGGVDAALLCGDFNEDLRDMAAGPDNAWRRTNLRVLWPPGGLDARGWRWGSYHGYHNDKKAWTTKGRVIDGAVAFGRSESVRVDGAELMGVPPEAAEADEDDHDALADMLADAPADHFPVRTDLTISSSRAPAPVDYPATRPSEWLGRSVASSNA